MKYSDMDYLDEDDEQELKKQMKEMKMRKSEIKPLTQKQIESSEEEND